MAIPRVFISSTCYDLKYIRENLKYFIRQIGYEPVLSEEGDVFYNPETHTHDACLAEVLNTQIMVLIIGGRFGGKFKDSEKSITNKEYDQAVQQKIPIFALVESGVYAEHHIYTKNRDNKKVNANAITYPSVDSIKIFDFVDDVRKNVTNNAVFQFNDFADIEAYLRKQWAAMMFNFLTTESEARRVGILFDQLNDATRKIEYFTRQMASSTGNEVVKFLLEMYDYAIGLGISRELPVWGLKPDPVLILKYEDLDSFCNNNIKLYEDEEESGGWSITHGGPPYQCSKLIYERLKSDYAKLRNHIIKRAKEEKIELDRIINYSST